jgi:hypothetical protein
MPDILKVLAKMNRIRAGPYQSRLRFRIASFENVNAARDTEFIPLQRWQT